MTRKEKIEYLKRNYLADFTTGLEIAPNIAPMISKKDGYKIEYLDACTTEELQERAINIGRSIECAPKIDYKHDFQQSIAACVEFNKFDFAVSSHVIEHVPDLIGHFQEVQEILNNGGIYAFLAPDKELCFDAKKTNTSLGQVIEARIERRRKAPINALIDEYYYGVKRGGKGGWSEQETEPFRPKYSNSRKLIQDVIKNPKIMDAWHGHIWRFTPASFKEIFNELNQLGLVNLSLIDVLPTKDLEFAVILSS